MIVTKIRKRAELACFRPMMDKFAFSVSTVRHAQNKGTSRPGGGRGEQGRVSLRPRFLGSHDDRCPRISDTKCSSLRIFDDDDSNRKEGRGEIGPRVEEAPFKFNLRTRISNRENFPVSKRKRIKFSEYFLNLRERKNTRYMKIRKFNYSNNLVK